MSLLFLNSPSLGTLGKLCFMIVAIPVYLHLNVLSNFPGNTIFEVYKKNILSVPEIILSVLDE